MFTMNGRNFDEQNSFPPIDEKHIQNAVMIAPCNNEMLVFGWGCYNHTGDNNADVWEWEPLFPLSSNDGRDLINLIANMREGLGI